MRLPFSVLSTLPYWLWKMGFTWAKEMMNCKVRWLVGGVIFISIQLMVLYKVDTESVITAVKSIRVTMDKEDVMDHLPTLMQMPLYDRLLTVFPYEPNTLIPKNIIQTSKNKDETNKEIEMWKSNIDFNYTMYDDQMALQLLLKHFGLVFPEIIETYNSFPRVILRVDFFRYASVFLKGGVYSDTDTVPAKPLADWLTYNETVLGHTVGAVVGIESECDCQDWQNVYSRRVQFCQWTLQAKRHHPLYAKLLVNIVEMMTQNYDQNTRVLQIGEQKYDFSKGQGGYYNGIMELTGPGAYTTAVFDYLNSLGDVLSINPNDQATTFANLRHPDPDLKLQSNRQPQWQFFGWENVTKIQEPVLVDDVLILPEKYLNGKVDNEQCLVEHRFHGSWKSETGGVTYE